MKDNDLVVSFENSLDVDITEFAIDAVEFGIDLSMDDGILKDIPFVGTAFKLYSIGNKVYDKHCFGKLYSFIGAINCGNYSQEDKDRYRRKFVENESFRKQELEYLLVLIERYIGFEKPKMLARIYLAYLDEIIDWMELTKYAEVIDRFLSGDALVLCSQKQFKTIEDKGTDILQRLIALGLVIEEIRKTNIIVDDAGNATIDAPEIMRLKERNYVRTPFGDVLVSILTKYRRI